MRRVPILLAAGLAACTASPPDPSAPACGADGYQSLVGRPLAAVSLPADLPQRVIRPGEIVTMEYRADRLTIDVDESGTVTSVRCG